jgi:outer membrane immunogenic protein
VKVYLLGSVAFLALAATAAAQEAPVAVAPPTWTGFYAGVNAGAQWGQNVSTVGSQPTFVNPGFNPDGLAFFAAATAGGNGVLPGGNSPANFIGGGQTGYNYQLARIVLGIEADLQGTAGNTSTTAARSVTPTGAGISAAVTTSSLAVQTRLDYVGTLRGRFGALLTPTLLVYGTGGFAYGQVTSRAEIDQFFSSPNGIPQSFSDSSNGVFSAIRAGWTLGGGLEWMLTPNWIAKFEYLHYDLGSVTYDAGARSAFFPAGPTPFWQHASNATTAFRYDVVRVGLNFKFSDVW